MRAHQADFSVSRMCDVLGVSSSGYYDWKNRGPSARDREDQKLLEHIKAIHRRSRGTYGSPRIHAALKAEGIRIGKKRVARLMREADIQGVSRRTYPTTTRRSESRRPAPDLVDRDFEAEAPNHLWVADITYVPTASGYLYVSVVMDAFSRRIVGWSMASHLRTELVEDALEMAITQREAAGVIHHSDQGSQYTSVAFGHRCREAGIRPSMGSVGDCYDNAMCESFFATLECELIERESFETKSAAEAAIFSYIEGWYNPHRLHSALDYTAPNQYERRWEKTKTTD